MGPQVPIEIIEAARAGDPADIERLLQAIWADTYRLARGIVIQAQSAEDVAQEACITIFRSIATLRKSDAFRRWLYRIVVREALKRKKMKSEFAPIPLDAAYCEDPSASLDLWRALAALPGGLRAVIVLHYLEGLSSPEIAQILSVPEATVRFRLMTARRRLRPLLQDTESFDSAKGENVYAL